MSRLWCCARYRHENRGVTTDGIAGKLMSLDVMSFRLLYTNGGDAALDVTSLFTFRSSSAGVLQILEKFMAVNLLPKSLETAKCGPVPRTLRYMYTLVTSDRLQCND